MPERKKEIKEIEHKGKKVSVERYEGDDIWVIVENKNGE